jgi:dTDP-4-dehydrorhamnose reductase
MTSLVLGASGQVGSALMETLATTGPCRGTGYRHPRPGLVSLDLRDGNAVRALLRETRPDVCYLPAAWTHVDAAEEHPAECRAINVDAVDVVARELASLGGVLVLFSTDHVFGERDTPWREDEPVAPVSVYARCKAEGEGVVREVLPERHLILRTSWVFGPDPQGKNFVHRVRATLARGDVLVVPDDQWGQPTFAPDLAWTAGELVRRGERGTFHVVGPAWLDRLTWARTIAATLGLDARRIEGRPTATLGAIAPRPLRVGLARDKLLATLGFDPLQKPDRQVRAA